MKQIIIGQLMLWGNVATVIIGNYLVMPYLSTQFIEGLLVFIGIVTSAMNVFFAVAVQVEGYQKLKIINRETNREVY